MFAAVSGRLCQVVGLVVPSGVIVAQQRVSLDPVPLQRSVAGVLDDASEQLQVLDRFSFGIAPVVRFPGLEVLGHALEEQLGVCADPKRPCSPRVQLVDFADGSDCCGIFCSVVSAGPGEWHSDIPVSVPGEHAGKARRRRCAPISLGAAIGVDYDRRSIVGSLETLENRHSWLRGGSLLAL